MYLQKDYTTSLVKRRITGAMISKNQSTSIFVEIPFEYGGRVDFYRSPGSHMSIICYIIVPFLLPL